MDSLDTGDTGANENFWGGLLQKIGNSAANRVTATIDPPKVDASPVPNTAVLQNGGGFGVSVDSRTVMLVALGVGAFLLIRHFSK
jgi:hypothetical protein